MNEYISKSIYRGLDAVEHYASREDTIAARTLAKLSSGEGAEYRNSLQKRVVDRTLAGLFAVATIPLQAYIAHRIYQGHDGPILYHQDRLRRDGALQRLAKFRTLRVGSDPDGTTSHQASQQGRNYDSRATAFGARLRRSNLDELPQLWSVARGDLSLNGIRSIAPYAYDHMLQERQNTANEWWRAYSEGDPSFIHLNSLANTRWPKNDAKRHHFDMLYARRASLGMDLFVLIWLATDTVRKLLPVEQLPEDDHPLAQLQEDL